MTTNTLEAKKTQDVEPTRVRPTLRPPVDIYEKDNSLVIEADMPGVGERDVEVVLEKSELTLRGRVTPPAERETHFHREFGYADFERTFSLSDGVDVDNIKATVRNGVLRVVLPHAKDQQPRRIQVQAG